MDANQPKTSVTSPRESSNSEAAAPDMESEAGPFLDRFVIKRALGEGSYGKVKLAFDMLANRTVALKIIQKASLKKSSHITRLKREVRIMRLLHHPHIARLYDVTETDREIVLVMEHVEGGELFDYIVAHKRLKERIARRLFRQIVSAVDYCHQSSIIHRDLKPENLLLDTDRNIKIIDFGFVKLYDRYDMLKTFCGSPFYASPEMILGKQYAGPEVDVWSMGVILFALLNGHLPFRDSNNTELYRKISQGVYETQTQYMTASSADLIKKMLTVDPETRATIEQIRNHPWVLEGCDGPPESLVPPRPNKILDPDPETLASFLMYGLDTYPANTPLENSASSAPAFALYCLLKESAAYEDASPKGSVSTIAPTVSITNTTMTAEPVEQQEQPAQPRPEDVATPGRRRSFTIHRKSLLSVNQAQDEQQPSSSLRGPRGPAAYGSIYQANQEAIPRRRASLSSTPSSPSTGPTSPPTDVRAARKSATDAPRNDTGPRAALLNQVSAGSAGTIPALNPAAVVPKRRKSILHDQVVAAL
ncbi:hypothetical protein HK104_006278, partial [Borealophlyctis nickersoniae]